jgi:methyl-accepting chemotaxis protein
MELSFRRLIRTYVVLVLIGLTSLGLVGQRLRQQWADADALAERSREDVLTRKAAQIEGMVRQVRQSLRMISLLPAVRAYAGPNQPASTDAKYDPVYFPDAVRETVQQIYNNLASNVAISEVYGVLRGFRPEAGEKPFFMLDELILRSPAGGAVAGPAGTADSEQASAPPGDAPPEFEDAEYAWFVTQLAAFEAAHPRFDFKTLDDIPMSLSPPLRTCDNSQYLSLSKGDPKEALGIGFAVPFYDAQGALRGLIVGLLRLNVLEAALTDSPFVVVTEADRAAARQLGLDVTAPAHPLVLRDPVAGLRIFDRRQPALAGADVDRDAGFLSRPVGGVPGWTVSLLRPASAPRAGLAELLFLVGVASLVVGGSFVAMVVLARRLRAVEARLATIGDQVADAGGTLREGSASLAERALTASAALTEIGRSMAEFQRIDEATRALGGRMTENAARTRSQAAAGTAEVAAARTAVGHVAGIAESVDVAVASLKDLAFQTNLLAVNASVEAARAGQAGLGFAVVADAVRTLAQRSDTAARDIEARMAEARHQVDAAVRQVDGTAQTFAGIAAAAAQADGAARELQTALEANARGVSDLQGGLAQLEEVNHHTASAAEELSAVAADFQARTEALDAQVGAIGRLVN